VEYWVRKQGRLPGPDELEPYTRAYWQAGRRVSAASYLLALDDLRAFSRSVARFFTAVDIWLTPTLSEPPVPLGELTSSAAEPWRPAERMSRFVAYPAIVANITGAPAMSVPLHWNAAGLPIGVHFLGRFGDDATLFWLAAQLEQARPRGRAPSRLWSSHRSRSRRRPCGLIDGPARSSGMEPPQPINWHECPKCCVESPHVASFHHTTVGASVYYPLLH
jgi:hypothetical protein